MNIESNQYELVTTNHWLKETSYNLLPVGAIIFPKRGAAIATNKKRITRIPCLIDNNCMGLVSHDINILLPEYLFYYLLGFDLTTISNSAGIALINNGDIASVKIPLPEISIQRATVESLQKERGFINSTIALMRLYEQKIKDRIAKVWGE